MNIRRLTDLDIKGKRVLVRLDLNVPVEGGRVISDARIRAAMPTLLHAVKAGATIMVMSHLGRPEEGRPIAEQPQFSLRPVAQCLAGLTGLKVRLVDEYLHGYEPEDEDIALFENVRLNLGEQGNDAALSEQLGRLCDVFVMDAFGTAHRAQASTEGIVRFAPVACSGLLLTAELNALETALREPEKPMIAIVGGSKISTKLQVLEALLHKVDTLIVGGGIANTFLAAAGVDVGRSLIEQDLVPLAGKLLEQSGGERHLPLPTDVVVAREISVDATASIKKVSDIESDEMIVDLGPDSLEALCELMVDAGTILWNGPVGVAEIPQFARGTERLARCVAGSRAFSLAGGGDTLAVIDQYDLAGDISYVSTGGGAFLEFVEGKTLPAVSALIESATQAGHQQALL